MTFLNNQTYDTVSRKSLDSHMAGVVGNLESGCEWPFCFHGLEPLTPKCKPSDVDHL